MMLLAVLGCVDQGFSEIKLDAIAVVQGDFDNVGDTLTALDINTQPYDGFIVQATYEVGTDERTKRGYGAPTFEGLLTNLNEAGKVQLELFNAAFINSGVRGLGAWQYNNTLEADNSVLLDAYAMESACEFANNGGTLVVSDWAYDLVEYCWPDAIEFFGDDLVYDAAQAGMPDSAVGATVHDEALVEALGTQVNIAYDYSAWSVIESVGAATETLLSGTISYQPSADELPVDLADAPLLVRFNTGSGTVVYSTFHWSAQAPQLTQSLLLNGVEGLEEGGGSESSGIVEDTGE